MEDQPADSGDLTPDDPGKPRRRGLFGRRGKTDSVTEAQADTGKPATEARPKARPVGKSARSAPAEAPVEEPVQEPVDDNEETVEDSADETPAEIQDEVPDAEAETAADEPVEENPEPVLVPFRPAGKRLTAVAAGAAVLFVAAGAYAGAMVQPYLSDRALVDTKLEVAKTSAEAITTLWTYTPDDIESLPNRAAKYLSNDFSNQYRTFIDSIVPTNKQAQVSNNTQVVGTAVESIGRDEATAIVYTNSVSTSPVTKNIPSLRYLSYRLTLKRDGSDWRITQMPALTQLDLSPQL